MTPEQKAQLKEWLGQMTDAEKRVLKYTVNGGHRCDASTNLITCCGVSRCQACHIPHLKEAHSIEQLHAYEKFANARSLTWQVREYKLPLKTNKTSKVNKKTVSSKADARSLASAVSDDQLESVLAMLAERMKKNGTDAQ